MSFAFFKTVIDFILSGFKILTILEKVPTCTPFKINKTSFWLFTLLTPLVKTLAFTPTPSIYIPGFDLILFNKLTLDDLDTLISLGLKESTFFFIAVLHPIRIKIKMNIFFIF